MCIRDRSLTQDLHAYVGKIEYLQTGHLPAELRNRVRHDLTQHPRNDGSIPGLNMSVMDSGASAICMKSKTSILPSTYEILQNPIHLGGIASGLKIIGKGQTSFEFISTKGKKIRVI